MLGNLFKLLHSWVYFVIYLFIIIIIPEGQNFTPKDVAKL